MSAHRPVRLSKPEARRFLAARHLLDAPRSLPPTPQSVLELVKRLGSLQFDPLEVPGARNHELVLFARIGGARREWLHDLLYAPPGVRRLYEAYNKALNILPLDDLPYHRMAWDRARARYDKTILSKRSRRHTAILDRIRAEGPLDAAAFRASHNRKVAWHWAATSEGRAVLEALFETGTIGISTRDGNRRVFDLVERLFPAELLSRRVTRDEALRHRLLSRFVGMGLLSANGTPEVMAGTAPAAERRRVVEELAEDGVLAPVEIEGVRGLRYALRAELEADWQTRQLTPGVSLLAPLDPLLWDRNLLLELYGFDYKWEVYTPEARRRFGYYVLPLLFGDRLVGRIEPRFDRATGHLTILGRWFEAGFRPRREDGFQEAFDVAIAAYASFVGATTVR